MSSDKTAFTPGPWHVFEPISKHGCAASVGSWLPDRQTRYLICETLDIPLDDDGSRVSHDIGLANARLIAASPALYAALADLLTLVGECADDIGPLVAGGPDSVNRACDTARAALRLAREGSPRAGQE